MHSKNPIWIIFSCLLIQLSMSGCAAVKSISHNKDYNLQYITYGVSDKEVERYLGYAEKTVFHKNGTKTEHFTVKPGMDPSLLRASVNGSFSLASSGFWELLANPIEELYDKKYLLVITYNPDGEAEDIQYRDVPNQIFRNF